MRRKRRIKRALMLFSIGGFGYGMIEILFRGWTHWSMVLTGGVCFTGLDMIARRMRKKPLWLRCAAGAGMITGVEFLVGLLVNQALRLNVWDYSHMRGNIRGQICPLFSAAWFVLCFPAFALLRMLGKRLS